MGQLYVMWVLGGWVGALVDSSPLTFGNSLGVCIFHLGQGQLIGNITLLKRQNTHRVALNINRLTTRLRINPNFTGFKAISFSLMHTSVVTNKEKLALGSQGE